MAIKPAALGVGPSTGHGRSHRIKVGLVPSQVPIERDPAGDSAHRCAPLSFLVRTFIRLALPRSTSQPRVLGASKNRLFATEMMCLAADASNLPKSPCTAALIHAGWPTTRSTRGDSVRHGQRPHPLIASTPCKPPSPTNTALRRGPSEGLDAPVTPRDGPLRYTAVLGSLIRPACSGGTPRSVGSSPCPGRPRVTVQIRHRSCHPNIGQRRPTSPNVSACHRPS
jgi:hypothetical protein